MSRAGGPPVQVGRVQEAQGQKRVLGPEAPALAQGQVVMV